MPKLDKQVIVDKVNRELQLYSFPKDVTVKVTFRVGSKGKYSQAVREVIRKYDRHGDPVYQLQVFINVNPKRIRSEADLEEIMGILRKALVEEAGGVSKDIT